MNSNLSCAHCYGAVSVSHPDRYSRRLYALVQSPFLAAIFMLWLVVIIEKLIHTTYTVTPDGKLVLSFGRFSRSKEILMKDITSVERASSMQVGRFAVMRYVLVKYGEGKCAVLLPVKEEEFIRVTGGTERGEQYGVPTYAIPF